VRILATNKYFRLKRHKYLKTSNLYLANTMV